MEGSEERTKITGEDVEEYLLRGIARLRIDPGLYSFGQLSLMIEESDTQKQIDRACAAQSNEMLPTPKAKKTAVSAAQERIKAAKSKYKKPASSIDYAISPRHNRRESSNPSRDSRHNRQTASGNTGETAEVLKFPDRPGRRPV